MLEQRRGDFDMVVLRRRDQRRLAIGGLGVHIRALLQEQLDIFGAAFLG